MTRRYSGPLILSIGFRPFFIASGTWAVLSVLAWIAALGGYIELPGYIAPAQWHYNELLFGVIGAAMAGFLLTAIPNWTGGLPLRGAPLLLFFGLWCAGRVVVVFGGSLGALTVAVIDCAFYVIFFALVLREILAGRNWRNLPVCAAVALFAVAHILFYLEALDAADIGGAGQRLGLGVIACLLALIGGRIVPSFTANWLKRHGKAHGGGAGVAAVMGPIDKAALLVTVSGVLAWVFFPEHPISGWALVLAGVANCLRLSRWRGLHTGSEPMLFVLHVGYGWLAAAFLLLGAAVLSPAIAQADALHALTIGAAGTMILAVMSRAILGHSGREPRGGSLSVATFSLVSIAALARVGVMIAPAYAAELYNLSGLAWIFAFGLFLWRFAPIAIRG